MLILPQNSPAIAGLNQRLQNIRARMAAAARTSGRSEQSVTLVAVSKGHAAGVVRAAAGLGAEHFGESYLQEALPKIEALRGSELTWHFIGRLQANKTRPIAQHFDWVHGVDRAQIAQRLSEQRPHYAPPLNICLQVNIAGDDNKAGIAAVDVPALVQSVSGLPRLRLRGLMCMLPEGLDSAMRRQHFSALRTLLRQLDSSDTPLDTLSMGMSGDFEDAILEGSTMVRIGTAIFGLRMEP